MTASTNDAVSTLRDELHARTLIQDPQQAYETVADLGTLLAQAAHLLDHVRAAVHQATGHDERSDDLEATLRRSIATIDSQHGQALAALGMARAGIEQIHEELSHLIWTEPATTGSAS